MFRGAKVKDNFRARETAKRYGSAVNAVNLVADGI